MSAKVRGNGHKVRSHQAITQSSNRLDETVDQTARLWRRQHLGYDQTKYVVEQVRRRLGLEPPRGRRRTVNRLDQGVDPTVVSPGAIWIT